MKQEFGLSLPNLKDIQPEFYSLTHLFLAPEIKCPMYKLCERVYRLISVCETHRRVTEYKTGLTTRSAWTVFCGLFMSFLVVLSDPSKMSFIFPVVLNFLWIRAHLKVPKACIFRACSMLNELIVFRLSASRTITLCTLRSDLAVLQNLYSRRKILDLYTRTHARARTHPSGPQPHRLRTTDLPYG